jgi:GntR family transcriptional repressor for pyruvate dehydrogenase complex
MRRWVRGEEALVTATKLASDVRVPKTGELVAAQLRRAIVRGELKPGDRLPSEAELVAQYHVSRPTLREALRILEFESLVRVSRGVGGGARVCLPSHNLVTHAAGLALGLRGATVQEVFMTRIMIEPQAARFAAEHVAQTCASALRERLVAEHAAPTTDFCGYNERVADFHRALLEFCGNPGLAVVGQALQDIITQHMSTALRNLHPPAELQAKLRAVGLKSQERLIALIAAEDGAGAEAHWARHLEATSVHVLYGVRNTRVVDVLD